MPVKIRKLKADLARAGFVWRSAKGSHTYWTHPQLPGISVTISGSDGDDADRYQIKQVADVLKRLGGK
jgi:predicted RNA binding protein YcfA (HicA-like mRNA interferase family)